MIERTQQELQRIKDAVLAELKTLKFEDGKHDLAPRLRIEDHCGKEYGWWAYTRSTDDDWDGATTFWVSDKTPADDPYWGIAYSVLHLEARAERERAQPMYDALNVAQAEIRALYPRLGYLDGGSILYAIDKAMDDWKGAQQA